MALADAQVGICKMMRKASPFTPVKSPSVLMMAYFPIDTLSSSKA
jgi:hypothetical protein